MNSQQNNTSETEPGRTSRQAEMFANRIAKNRKHLGKWAKSSGIECFRVYDRDIPELAFALDVYGARAHLQEYSRPPLDERSLRAWLGAMHAAAAAGLGMAPADVVLKRRHGQQPQRQYGRLAGGTQDFEVGEGGHRFIVNLSEHLDTGLFLDHRQTRALAATLARGGDVLNLFCYTGAFSVYAACGGAASTTSVDMSRTYLDWAKRNFALNGMDHARNRLVQADAVRFIAEQRGSGRRYGLIVLDPPSFSNSRRMQGVLDVQRDHVALVTGCAALLAPGGELLFSTNLHSFRLDAGSLAGLRIEDISSQTVPPDFRNRKIHRCWRITAG